MSNQTPLLNLTPKQAVPIAAVVVFVLALTMIKWGFVPLLSLLIVILGLLMFGLTKGISFEAMQDRRLVVLPQVWGRFICFQQLDCWYRHS